MGRLQSESGSNLTLLERRSPPTPMGSLLIDRQHDGVVRRIDLEPDDVARFAVPASALGRSRIDMRNRQNVLAHCDGRKRSECASIQG